MIDRVMIIIAIKIPSNLTLNYMKLFRVFDKQKSFCLCFKRFDIESILIFNPMQS